MQTENLGIALILAGITAALFGAAYLGLHTYAGTL